MKELNPIDITVVVQPVKLSGWYPTQGAVSVTVKHTPTGISATAEGRSTHAARHEAFEMLTVELKNNSHFLNQGELF